MFTYYEKESAPEEAKNLMEESEKNFKMIPNLHRILAEAPVTYKAYNELAALFKKTSLTPLEQQVVLMTANFENNCHYCVPGHTFGMKSAKMPDDIIEALREGTEIPDKKLQALHDYTKELLDSRGHIGDERLQKFLDAGYSKRQALEVFTGIAAKTISNFTNAVTHTKVDDAMKPYEWKHPKDRKQIP